MKNNCTITVSTKDGYVRNYEGPALYVVYTSNDECLIINGSSDCDAPILALFRLNDILEMTVMEDKNDYARHD